MLPLRRAFGHVFHVRSAFPRTFSRSNTASLILFLANARVVQYWKNDVRGAVTYAIGKMLVLQQSLGWLDENGRGIRYQYPYDNEPDPTVPRVPIRGRAALPADRIDPGVSGPPAR